MPLSSSCRNTPRRVSALISWGKAATETRLPGKPLDSLPRGIEHGTGNQTAQLRVRGTVTAGRRFRARPFPRAQTVCGLLQDLLRRTLPGICPMQLTTRHSLRRWALVFFGLWLGLFLLGGPANPLIPQARAQDESPPTSQPQPPEKKNIISHMLSSLGLLYIII